VNVLIQFSRLVIEQPWIEELDNNPLVASPEGIIALDARIILQDPNTPDDLLPRPAIRPYPMRYVSPWTATNGMQVLLRPVRPEDEPAMARFNKMLSDRSVYLRYFHMQKLSSRVAHERLLRKCFIDYDREMALVADGVDPASGEHEIMAVGRLTRMHGSREAEVAVLVADRFQRCGLGSELLGRLIQVARDERLERIAATVLFENLAMRSLASRYGFKVVKDADLSVLRAVLTL
jgi:acetyltransferase